jgi:hypothetical protein
MADEPLPDGTYEEASEAWLKFEATDDPGSPRDELEAALLVAAKKARADERERIRQVLAGNDVQSRLVQLVGWAKDGERGDCYLMDREKTDRLRSDVISYAILPAIREPT